jgi:hypothetical protein
MMQVGRNLTDVVDGFLRDKRYMIMDRDPLFTDAYRKLLSDGGVKPVQLSAKSPNLNAFAKRFVLSIKSECLIGWCCLARAIFMLRFQTS